MGNYYGTVRCGVCYERGHNKRSCPEELKRLQRRFDNANSGNCEYDTRQAERLAAQIAKRTGVNPLTGKKLEKRGPVRRCSYCKYKHGSYSDAGLGHTRRTCPDMKADKQQAIERTAELRRRTLESMREHGIGIGALVKQKISGYFADPNHPGETRWDRRETVCLVQKIYWDDVSIYNPGGSVVITQRADKFGTNDYESMGLPYILDDEGNRLCINRDGEFDTRGNGIGGWHPTVNDAYNKPEIVSPVSPSAINPPASWLSGRSSTITQHFNAAKA